MWRIYYLMHLMKDKKGIGVVEVILILVVALNIILNSYLLIQQVIFT